MPIGSAGASITWCTFNGAGAGTFSPDAGSNVSTITKGGLTGQYTITFTTAMASTDYAVCVATNAAAIPVVIKATASCEIQLFDYNGTRIDGSAKTSFAVVAKA